VAETPFASLDARNYTAVNYSFVFVDDAGVPHRFTGPMPVMDADGNFGIGGSMSGGFGAKTTVGSTDWNHVDNSTSGSGRTLMQPSATNGPGGSGYFHPFNFEYATKTGAGNVTQFAIPYSSNPELMGVRGRFGGTWSTWRQILVQGSSADFSPWTDNTRSLGLSSLRFSVVYAGTGTINTSDEREKNWLGELSPAHMRAARRIAAEIGCYQFLDAVAEKGELGARIHIGVRAQRVAAIMIEEGLEESHQDAPPTFRHAFLCYNQWEVDPELGIEAADRYGIRVDQLALFLIAAQEARLAALEAADVHPIS